MRPKTVRWPARWTSCVPAVGNVRRFWMFAILYAPGGERRSKQARRRDCILDSEVDPHPADRRHGVGGVADQQRTGHVGARKRSTWSGQDLDVVPSSDLFYALDERGEELGDSGAKGVDAWGDDLFVGSLPDHLGDLPVVTAVDPNQDPSRPHAPLEALAVARLAQDAKRQPSISAPNSRGASPSLARTVE